MKPATASSFSRDGIVARVGLLDRGQQQRPALDEELVEDLVLGVEVVVDEPVGDLGLARDVGDAAVVEALPGEDADRGVEDLTAAIHRRCLGHQAAASTGSGQRYGGGTAVGERRQGLANALLRGEVEVGGDEALLVGRLREDHAPRVDDRRAAIGAVLRRRLAVLVGRDHERSVLDRPRAQQHVPVIAAGRQRERRWDREDPRAADREDPVELAEAQVVTDGESQLDAVDVGADDLLARLLARRLLIADPAHLDVEHVDLAVGRRRSRRRGRSGTRC